MRLKVNNVRVSLLEETSVKEAAAKKLGLKKQDIENLQILGEADGTNFNEAYKNLVNEKPWITEEKYGEENIYYKIIKS